MGTRFLTLSLFIMMLSFFIVLNSFSTFEETKTRDLLQSVTKTFSYRPQNVSFVPPLQEGGSDVDKNPLDRLDSVFQTEIGSGESRTNRLRTTMRVRLPAAKLESMIAAGDAEGQNFMPVLASLLDSSNATVYTMKMVMNVAANPAVLTRQNPQKVNEAITKVSALIQAMQDAGLPPESMAAGLGEGPEQTVDLYFERVRASSARSGDL